MILKTMSAATRATCPVRPAARNKFPVTVKKKILKNIRSLREYLVENTLYKSKMEVNARKTL